MKKIIRHGNCLAVVVPKPVCRDLFINRGDFVVVVLASEDRIVIQKITNDTAKSLLEKDVRNKK